MKHTLLLITVFYLFGCKNSSENKTNNKDTVALEQPQNQWGVNDSTSIVKNQTLTYEEAYNQALKLWQVPFEEKYINTHFGKAHVIVSGPENAEPLILLHGLNASSTMWYPNIKQLSEYYRIYAIDFFMEPGKSVCQREVENTTQIIDWYYEIFDQLHLKKFSLLGASRGGWLGMNIALRDKKRVDKIVLLSPAQTFTWIKPGSDIMYNIAYSIFPKRKHLRSVLETMTVDIDKISQAYINQYYLATKKATLDNCFMQMTPFTDKQLKSLTMPVLLMVGDADIINDAESLKRAKKLLPNLTTLKIKNAGHFLSVDQPEIVNKEIIDFLKQKKSLFKLK
ncbi:MAG: alpha/beta hydrolase [Bacteroidota bacterium]